jgi:hypothetical protein
VLFVVEPVLMELLKSDVKKKPILFEFAEGLGKVFK